MSILSKKEKGKSEMIDWLKHQQKQASFLSVEAVSSQEIEVFGRGKDFLRKGKSEPVSS